MSIATADPVHTEMPPAFLHGDLRRIGELAEQLHDLFGIDFSLWDGESGELLRPGGDTPLGDELEFAPIIQVVATRSDAHPIAEEPPIVVFALPIQVRENSVWVAVAPIVTANVTPEDLPYTAQELLGLRDEEVEVWLPRQPVRSFEDTARMGRLFQEKLRSDQEAMRLRDEVENVSNNLASTYEEISLLYGLTQNLRISSSPEDLGQLALDWLIEVVPCEGLAIEYLDRRRDEITDDGTTEESLFLTCGDCPVDEGEFAHLIEAIDHSAKCGPLVANRNITSAEGWLFPSVRELVVVPLAEGKNVFGYLAAFNHSDESEFGTIEASLLGSVGVILGIHSANIDLYRKQAEMLTGIVRALTSAIDAKDPYTCGHSDRVARIAVRLAEELGVDPETLRMLYMAGLLHDIGKIGIDDNVLRKPGRLTDAEYEHIKLHPELGFKILKDLSHLSEVLPIVLHHHEQWDGRGYPHGLEGENIPMAARITAVADAYDAMTSDRPYRRGMDEEKVEEIFRSGAGKQWDARVVSAFFRAREDVRDISSRERSSSPMEFQVW